VIVEQKTLLYGIAGATAGTLAEIAGWGVVVVIVSLFGWAVSSLDQLAGWTDDATRLTKLSIVKGVFASIAAAALVVLLGHWQGWHPLVNVVAAFLGGMSGDKLLRPMADGMIARLQLALDAVFGSKKPPTG
jgi:hypothetical protein